MTIQGLMVEKQASNEELLTLAEQALKTDNIVIVKAALEQLGRITPFEKSSSKCAFSIKREISKAR
jgi:hypothetical protein